MNTPTKVFDPVITLGNLITLGTFICTGVWYFAYVHSDTQNFKEKAGLWDKQIASFTVRVTTLEEWKSIAPRFTTTDAALLKTTALADSMAYTNTVANKAENTVAAAAARTDAQLIAIAAKTDVNLAAMSVKIDNLADNINSLKILVAGLTAEHRAGK